MPIYEYLCSDCNQRFELLAKSMASGRSTTRCPKCGSADAQRQLSSFAVSAGASNVPACAQSGACDSYCPTQQSCPFGNN